MRVKAPVHDGERIALHRRRVFILPTGQGMLLGAVLLAMLLGAINYNNSLAFALTFLLGSLAVVSILHTHRNLVRLELHAGRAPAVFAGEQAAFQIFVSNPTPTARYALRIEGGALHPRTFCAEPNDQSSLWLSQAAAERGWLALPRLTLSTRYPLGLFRAWAYVEPSAGCLVYPQPGPHRPLPVAEPRGLEPRSPRGSGADDFVGLRAYKPGDSPRHIHWKAAARAQTLQVKQFGGGDEACWLDWEQLPRLEPEARLSQLCRWVLEAHRAGISYGLRLPDGTAIAPGCGLPHRGQCLRALALFGKPREGRS